MLNCILSVGYNTQIHQSNNFPSKGRQIYFVMFPADLGLPRGMDGHICNQDDFVTGEDPSFCVWPTQMQRGVGEKVGKTRKVRSLHWVISRNYCSSKNSGSPLLREFKVFPFPQYKIFEVQFTYHTIYLKYTL